jgi:hydrogenase-4 component F
MNVFDPLTIVLITPLISVVVMLLMRDRLSWRSGIETVSTLAAGIECLAGFFAAWQVLKQHHYNISSFFSLDALSTIVLITIVFTGLIATLHMIGYLRLEMKKDMIGMGRLHQCYILTQLFIFSMCVASVATNPIIMWLAIEGTTLSTVFLISFFNRSSDVEAAWKYLIINSVGLLLGLLGTVLFLSQVGQGGLTDWNTIMAAANHMNGTYIKLGFGLILIGYGTKMGIVPMHTWRPDAYNKAPLPIVALLSGPLMNVAFLAILRFKLITDAIVGSFYSQSLLIFFGLLSVAIPAFVMYSQTNFKRLFAYSSTENAGVMLLGVAFGGIGIFGALLQMVYHTCTKALLFLLSSNITVHYSSSSIKRATGLLQTMPITATLFAIGLLSLLGVPPFGIFFSELYVALAGFAHYPLLSAVMLALLVLAFLGIARHGATMLFGKPPVGIDKAHFRPWMLVPVTVLAIVLIIIGLYLPNGMQMLLNESVAMLGGAHL